MAGRGSRFADVGFTDPKPLIRFGDMPMIQWVIDNIRPNRPHRFIFICLAEHLKAYPKLRQELEKNCPDCQIVTVGTVTEGAACTVLLARKLIDNDYPLMIVNSDQFVDVSIEEYLQRMEESQADGFIMSFMSDHPKWSYCRLSPDNTVTEVVEKKVVSNEATVGIYNFKRGREFVVGADSMIARNLRVKGEFYVAPVYNQLIQAGSKVLFMNIGSEAEKMNGLGTPEDLAAFCRKRGLPEPIPK